MRTALLAGLAFLVALAWWILPELWLQVAWQVERAGDAVALGILAALLLQQIITISEDEP